MMQSMRNDQEEISIFLKTRTPITKMAVTEQEIVLVSDHEDNAFVSSESRMKRMLP